MTINLDFKMKINWVCSIRSVCKHSKSYRKTWKNVQFYLFIFSINKNNDNNMQIKLFIDKEEREQKNTAKYFGIYFNKNLTWNKINTECINCKLSRGIGVVWKIRSFVYEKILRNILMLFWNLILKMAH